MLKIINNDFLQKSSEHLFNPNLHALLMIYPDKPAFRETRDIIFLHQFCFLYIA